ncbi:hypothetical protein CISIN_1g036677mg, partial [Citrus sinensis]
VIRELSGIILTRSPKLCNFVEWNGGLPTSIIFNTKCYPRENVIIYSGLYFCMCVDPDDNELEILDIIHHYVEILDLYF